MLGVTHVRRHRVRGRSVTYPAMPCFLPACYILVMLLLAEGARARPMLWTDAFHMVLAPAAFPSFAWAGYLINSSLPAGVSFTVWGYNLNC